MSPEDLADDIHWYGNAAIKIVTSEKTIYIDPFEIPNQDKADIILITHPHFDHLSEPDLKKLGIKDTVFVVPDNRQCIDTVEKLFNKKPVIFKPGEQATVAGVKIQAVPAYNVVKKERHPQAFGYLGYILTIEGIRIYHAGDTERIPEMKTFSCDIALLPLGQTYTMNSVEEAAQAALDVKARIAIPIHYGSYEGTLADAYKFKELLEKKVLVIIKTKE
ncbi:MAG: MBL fold metallo-hydrolase [Spirochaetales bacterium]|nr:MBL fold metallo-hydrolase [Spirochaetales bacterium]